MIEFKLNDMIMIPIYPPYSKLQQWQICLILQPSMFSGMPPLTAMLSILFCWFVSSPPITEVNTFIPPAEESNFFLHFFQECNFRALFYFVSILVYDANSQIYIYIMKNLHEYNVLLMQKMSSLLKSYSSVHEKSSEITTEIDWFCLLSAVTE